MLEFREIKCPNCGSPADDDNSTCAYCYAAISRTTHGGLNPFVIGGMFAVVLSIFVVDWYLGAGLTVWVSDALQQLSD